MWRLLHDGIALMRLTLSRRILVSENIIKINGIYTVMQTHFDDPADRRGMTYWTHAVSQALPKHR